MQSNTLIPQRQADAYQAGLSTIARMVSAMREGAVSDVERISRTDVIALSSHRGKMVGAEAVAGIFGPTSKGQSLDLWASNLYLAGTMTRARASGYLAGQVTEALRLAFGAVFVVDIERANENEIWLVSRVKVQISWVEGNQKLRPNWRYPVHEKVWSIGDPLHVIVSELDAPWHLFPDNELRLDVTRDVEDTYARYSWGIDQADFGLLVSSYAEDAAGTFSPMGPLTGRHAIVGVQKDFRRAWPWMQHYGDVLGSLVDGDKAAMIVARVIPQAGKNPDEFGAYYPLRLRRDGALWRIVWFEYRAGWFSSREMDIDELLRLTLSGEGDRPQ